MSTDAETGRRWPPAWDDAMGCKPVVIVMGVSGSGKSTIAEAMNARLHWPFQEGDALHPPANTQKMHAGIPLTDSDRAPWLAAIRRWIDARIDSGEPGLVTCSALKRRYRDDLVGGRSNVRLLYLRVDPPVLEERMAKRRGHFMPASLLESQLRTLEEPGKNERPIIIEANGGLEQTVSRALEALRTQCGEAGAAPLSAA